MAQNIQVSAPHYLYLHAVRHKTSRTRTDASSDTRAVAAYGRLDRHDQILVAAVLKRTGADR